MTQEKQRAFDETTRIALTELYGGQIPDYIISADKTQLTIRISDFQGSRNLTITPKDVASYYAWQASNRSGLRSLAGHSGDWRQIDNLAYEALTWFTTIDPLGEDITAIVDQR